MGDVAYLALGSNLGARDDHLRFARERIAQIPDTRILAESEIEETAPLGPVAQGAYLNQMIAIETALEPHALLAALHEIEQARGRVRGVRWGPRTLDIDIVLLEGRSLDDPDLTIPHPELPQREFWLRELAQVRLT
jgi:2-amino-4-hydroxy-6-hydroxymethyldihydropteridine diphosphokinase